MATFAVAAAGKERPGVTPSEWRKFRDAATEWELTRLTDPAVSSATMPQSPLRVISSGNNSLLYCSDRSGSPQLWRMDLKGGENRQVTEAGALLRQGFGLLGSDDSFVYIDGDALTVASRRSRIAYTVEKPWTFVSLQDTSSDGKFAAVVERNASRYRVRIAGLGRSDINTIFESGQPVRYARFRPKTSEIVYNHNGDLTLAGFNGGGSRRLQTPDKSTGDAQWSADGSVLHYLSIPAERGKLIALREIQIAEGTDKVVGQTTQFVSFARNRDSTVFAGISGSKAAPYLLLLVRSGRRELTVAEHRASDATTATVSFAPNSQTLFYGTDRGGRPALYSIALDKFVEKTEESG